MVEHQGNSILRKESRVSGAMVTIIHKVIITKIKSVITVAARKKNKKSIHMINDSSESDDDPIYI